jgi:tripartite-type tricarboxylate transporter receptor subunit TctC
MSVQPFRLAFLGLVVLVGSVVAATAVEFKTITLKVGYGAGGTYDLSSRLVARHLGKFLPGKPDIVVQNVPGGGSLKLVKLMLGSEPADGSVIASVGPTMAFAPTLDPENADFDASKIVWLGSLSNEPGFCVTTKSSGIDTLEKFLTGSFNIGASGKSSTTYQQAALVRKGLGAKFDIVTGFDGVAEIELAMERGELAGHCVATATELVKKGMAERVNVIGSFGSHAAAEFPDVPRFSAAISDPIARSAAELVEAARDVNYPLMVPPGTPEATVEALRKAYAEMTADPAFVAEVRSIGEFAFAPTAGEEMAKLVAAHLKAEAAVLEAARALVN